MKGSENESQAKSKLLAFRSLWAADSRQHWNRNTGRDNNHEPVPMAIPASPEESKMVLLLLISICVK